MKVSVASFQLRGPGRDTSLERRGPRMLKGVKGTLDSGGG